MNPLPKTGAIKSLLIANRGEIAIRVMRAATELGIRTIAIHSQEDRFSLHRTKADESYLVGDGKGPIDAYLDIDDIIRVAVEARADAVHPGYGFLSESPEFAEACAAAKIVFVGPLPDTMRRLGNKVEARNLAVAAGVPVMPATPPLPADETQVLDMARLVGFPVMLKASWGGGGRGMRIVEDDRELIETVAAARREAKAAFGKDEVYLEKLIRRARHGEVQILGDSHGNLDRRPFSRTRNAPNCARRRSKSAAPWAIAPPAPSSSCRTPTPASSISSKSTHAFRWNTP